MLHVGLDLHKKYSTVAVMDDDGNIQLNIEVQQSVRQPLTAF